MVKHKQSLTVEEIAPLRQEIVESQKARGDYLKFKLTAISAIAAIAFGFVQMDENHYLNPTIMLCVMPFVCVYIDLLCYHNTMRILVIGQFLNYYNDKYESYLNKLGKATDHKNGAGVFFEIEDFTLHWSSIFISFFVLLYGLSSFNCKNNLLVFFDIIFGLPLLFVFILFRIIRAKKLRQKNRSTNSSIIFF